MSLFLFLFVLQAIVAAALVGVVLMQRSEGGGLGIGGSPTGLMSARARPISCRARPSGWRSCSSPCRSRWRRSPPNRAGRTALPRPGSLAPGRSAGPGRGRHGPADGSGGRSGARYRRSARRRERITPQSQEMWIAGHGPPHSACPDSTRTLKARLPWRGTFSSPAAWFHRSAKVSWRPASARSSRRAATRSAFASSTPI